VKQVKNADLIILPVAYRKQDQCGLDTYTTHKLISKNNVPIVPVWDKVRVLEEDPVEIACKKD
jgi:hypothetical protein